MTEKIIALIFKEVERAKNFRASSLINVMIFEPESFTSIHD